jgi:hypothetical protein
LCLHLLLWRKQAATIWNEVSAEVQKVYVEMGLENLYAQLRTRIRQELSFTPPEASPLPSAEEQAKLHRQLMNLDQMRLRSQASKGDVPRREVQSWWRRGCLADESAYDAGAGPRPRRVRCWERRWWFDNRKRRNYGPQRRRRNYRPTRSRQLPTTTG